MKSVMMSTGGVLTPTRGVGKLPDARTPPRPSAPSPPPLLSTPHRPLSSVSSETIGTGATPMEQAPRLEDSLKMHEGIKSLQGTPKSGGSGKKSSKTPKDPNKPKKDKKDKSKSSSNKGSSEGKQKSPKSQKKIKTPGKAKSPKGSSKLKLLLTDDEKSKKSEPTIDIMNSPPQTSTTMPAAPSTPSKATQPPVSIKTPSPVKQQQRPSVLAKLETGDSDSDSLAASPKLVIAEEEARQREALEAKRCRLESYSDTIEEVVARIMAAPMMSDSENEEEKRKEQLREEQKLKEEQEEAERIKKENEERRIQREADIDETIDDVIRKAMESKDIYEFSDDDMAEVAKPPPTPKSPAVSEKKKEKKEKGKSPKGSKSSAKSKQTEKDSSEAPQDVKEKLKNKITQKTFSPDYKSSPAEKEKVDVFDFAKTINQSPSKTPTYNVSMSPAPAATSSTGPPSVQPLRLTIGKMQVWLLAEMPCIFPPLFYLLFHSEQDACLYHVFCQIFLSITILLI